MSTYWMLLRILLMMNMNTSSIWNEFRAATGSLNDQWDNAHCVVFIFEIRIFIDFNFFNYLWAFAKYTQIHIKFNWTDILQHEFAVLRHYFELHFPLIFNIF